MTAKRLTVVKNRLEKSELAAVVGALRDGQLVALPTETVYGIAARSDLPTALKRLEVLKGQRRGSPFAVHIGHNDLDSLPIRWNTPARRLATRFWPGPLMLVLPKPREEGYIGWRSPASQVTREILCAVGHPVVMTSANRSGGEPMSDADEIVQELSMDLSYVVDGGAPPLKEASTIVRLGGGPMQVLRTGILTTAELRAVAGHRYVFVCTGNTCRSPMASAWMRHRLANHLGCDSDEIESYGYAVDSMGIAAGPRIPASRNAVQALSRFDVDLSMHRSSALDKHKLMTADRIWVMGEHHKAFLIEILPELEGRVALIADQPVPDPIGGSLEDYAACSEVLRQAVAKLPI